MGLVNYSSCQSIMLTDLQRIRINDIWLVSLINRSGLHTQKVNGSLLLRKLTGLSYPES